MTKDNKKIEGFTTGFTLIELLVVIAIIGMISSIVLSSLNTARNKGADATVKQNLNNIRSQAALLYDTNNGNYNGICTGGDTRIQNMITSANGAGAVNTVCLTGGGASFTSYVMETGLKSGGYWCIDSSGNAKYEAVAWSGNPATCP